MTNITVGTSVVHEGMPLSFWIFGFILLLALVLNSTTAVLALKTLKRKLHNILIISLWLNNALVCLACLIYNVCNLFLNEYQYKPICIFMGIVLSHSLTSSYIIILLIGWTRFITIKSFNIGTNQQLQRYKYAIVGSVHFLTFTVSLLINTVLPTKNYRIKSCTHYLMYAENYPIYMAVLWGPSTIVLIAVIVMYAVNAFYIWKIFFKQHAKIIPFNLQMVSDDNSMSGETSNAEQSSSKAKKSVGETTKPLHKIEAIELEIIDMSEDQSRQKENSKATNQKSMSVASMPPFFISTLVRNQEPTTSLSNRTAANNRQWEIRAFKTNIIIASTTIFLSSPFVCLLWYDLFSNELASPVIRNIVFMVNIINYILDPFIYAFRVPEIGKQLKCLICKCRCRGHVVT